MPDYKNRKARAAARRMAMPAALLALLAPAHALAQETAPDDTIVVTASRTPQSIRQIGSAVTILDADMIENQQLSTLDEALERVPGVHMTRSGGYGQNTQVRMRGYTTKHVLVMIDGIKLNNPSEADNQYGLEHLFLDTVERIEVLRGPQSGLYGGDAVSGVINIITRRGEGDPSLRASALYGTENTYEGSIGSDGEIGRLAYSASATYFQTDGISLASRPPGNVEPDGYENLTLSLRGDWAVSDDVNLNGWVRYINSENDIDAGLLPAGNPLGLPASLFQDSPGSSQNEQWMAALRGTWATFGGRLTHNAQISYVDMTGVSISPGVEQDTEGRTAEASYYANLAFAPGSSVTAGVEHRIESGVFDQPVGSAFASVDETVTNTGLFLMVDVEPVDGLYLSAAVRYDEHESFGGSETHRLTAAYNFPDSFDFPGVDTKIRGSFGTGAEAPGLRQLLGSSVNYQGNPNLRPESSHMFDIGVDQSLENGRARWSVTYYDGRSVRGIFNARDPVTGISTPENINSPIDKTGIELELQISPTDWLDITASYTNATAIRLSDGQQTFGQPQNQFAGAVTIRPTDRLTLTLDTYWRDEFYSDYPSTWIMPGYALANLSGSYQLTDSVRVSARIQNLFDETYEEKLGDSTYGRTAQVRINYVF